MVNVLYIHDESRTVKSIEIVLRRGKEGEEEWWRR
jgi:hypothetical protein